MVDTTDLRVEAMLRAFYDGGKDGELAWDDWRGGDIHRDHLRAQMRKALEAAGRFAEAKLDEVAKLAPNWDGYGAPTPWPESVDLARRLIRLFARPPAVVAGGSGNVQLEWYGEGFEIEVYCHTPEDDCGPVTILIEQRTPDDPVPGSTEGTE